MVAGGYADPGESADTVSKCEAWEEPGTIDPTLEYSISHAPELVCECESAPAHKIAHDGDTYFSDESDGGCPRIPEETKEYTGKGTPIFNPEGEPKCALPDKPRLPPSPHLSNDSPREWIPPGRHYLHLTLASTNYESSKALPYGGTPYLA